MGNAERVWKFLKTKGFNDYACAGIIANLYCESGLNPKNLQDSYQVKLGFTDDSYVAAIDNGSYSREQFANDGAGAFLAQWTFNTRKRSLYDFAKQRGASIGDLDTQLDFFYKELSESYTSLYKTLTTVKSVSDAVVAVMLKYECPYDQSVSAQNRRISIGNKYYTQFTTNSMKGAGSMGYLYFTKGQSVKVSEHFSSNEFDCHGSGCCSRTIVNEKLVEYLEKIRKHFNAPITITSPYRCPTHNSRIGGAVGSRHSKGDAADIVVRGVAPRDVAKYAESIGIMGIGLYETSSDGHFVHIDTREKKSFWYGQKEAYRSTFGGSAINDTTVGTTTTTTTTYKTLTWGSSGSVVEELQKNLNTLGYSCGGVDGIYGVNTAEAVRKFQRDKKLSVDGIAGALTQSAIKQALSGYFSAGDTVVVVANLLNVRKGAGTNFAIMTAVKKNSTYTLSEVKNGWGKLKELSGWVSLEYVEKS